MIQYDIRERQREVVIFGGCVQFPEVMANLDFYLSVRSNLFGHHIDERDPFGVAHCIYESGFQQTIISSFTISEYFGFSRYCLCRSGADPCIRSMWCCPSSRGMPCKSSGLHANTSGGLACSTVLIVLRIRKVRPGSTSTFS